MLANTLQEHSYDGRYHPTNIQWSRSIYIPPDGDHRYAIMVGSHPAVLDGFVTQYRAELAKLHLFGAEHCAPNSREKDFTGKVLVLSPEVLREACWRPEDQLWLAWDGFGCRPNARGRSVRCTCLGDGEMTRWNRSEFVGILKDECLPDWAAEELAQLRQAAAQSPSMNEIIKVFFANLKRGGILLIQIAVGSLYMFSVPRGYTDGFIQWCKQVIGLCLTAFLQATILVAGLMVFKDHALLGLGLMLSAGEIPRIAGAFGLDTTTRANIMSAVYTAQTAVNMTRTVVQAVK